ncbi:hypothetical protein BN863_12430 [Formosa agariphila KMM 3901]|uniref:Uncharacterized protein n=1 Tax=Formosa agariphila (strain DSM 15362 / KCTC 12365 / LMG 23005 / KMM 3901 / M-2Alg 35-1) TaxID=1347342 RepID=T2KJK9_FORAG|nr:hypothetical protein [Formosa agariphila]CDF78955.1 hypothetical protein BN863_12430 [Formosa agariphila KMM 3901]
MKHILLCVLCLFCINFSHAKSTYSFSNNSPAEKQFNPILIESDYLSEQSQKFIKEEINFVRVCEEATKFWQSDETREARWEPRVEKYFNTSSYATFEKKSIREQLSIQQSQSDLDKIINIVTQESVSEFTTELTLFGFSLFLMGGIVVYTKGKYIAVNVLLTTVICVWFSLKSQIIKDNLEDFLILKNTRLTEKVYGINSNIQKTKSLRIPKDLESLLVFE